MLQRLQQLTIRAKLLTIALTGIVLFAVFYAFSFIATAYTSNLVRHIHDVDFVVLDTLNKNDLAVAGIREMLTAAITEEDEATLEDALVQVAERLRTGDFGFMGGAVSSAEVTALLP